MFKHEFRDYRPTLEKNSREEYNFQSLTYHKFEMLHHYLFFHSKLRYFWYDDGVNSHMFEF